MEKLNRELIKRRGKAGDISVVCMNNKGEWGGIATNIDKFTFAVATADLNPTVYLARNEGGKTRMELVKE